METRHKEVWTMVNNEKKYAVQIVLWDAYEDKKAWNVYLIVYKDHPKFDEFPINITGLLDGVTGNVSTLEDYFHWGITWNELGYDNKGNVASRKIGSDYMHLHDDRFSRYTNLDDAYEVKDDADKLYEFMAGM